MKLDYDNDWPARIRIQLLKMGLGNYKKLDIYIRVSMQVDPDQISYQPDADTKLLEIGN